MGRLRNEMMPHINSRIANTSTRKRLLRAKSTTLRIMKTAWEFRTPNSACRMTKSAVRGFHSVFSILYFEFCSSLLQSVLEHQSVGHYPVSRSDARHDLLHVFRQHIARHYLHAPELPLTRRDVHPVAVVKVQDCRSRHGGARASRLPAERRRNEHADAQHARVL